MQQVVQKAKTINEAIDSGLSHLKTTKENVTINILQKEKKGLFGIGRQEAIVQLTLINDINLPKDVIPQPATKQTKQVAVDKNLGKAWITNGTLYHKNAPDSFPVALISDGVELYRNDTLMKEKKVLLDELNAYTLVPIESHRRTSWSLNISNSKLEATLTVEPGFKTIRSVVDTKPDSHIEVMTEEQTSIINSINYEQIMRELQDNQIIIGYNQTEIIRAIETTEPGTFKVATGKRPGDGREGTVELLLNLDVKNGPHINEDGLANYRELKIIPNIKQGKIIALIHQPVQGKPGYTITNETIEARPYHDIIVKAGKGVIIIDDKIVAIESGRPHIQKRGHLYRVSIMPKLLHRDNVSISTGNIHFKGDVEILGEVQQGMTVEADGNIHIHKATNNATVQTSGSININGHIIHSEISAGRHNILISELGQKLAPIISTFESLIGVIKQVTLTQGFKSNNFSTNGLHSLIFILLENRFKHFPLLIKYFIEALKEAEPYLEDENWMSTLSSSTNLFLFLSPADQQVTLQGLEHLLHTLKDLKQLSDSPVEPNSYIIFKHASNSTIYSSGNIIITGTGCINTTLHSRGKVIASGIIRGGELFAQGGVELDEVGSDIGAPTVISVPDDQEIIIKKAYEGAILRIGEVKYTFSETTQHIKASLDKQTHTINFL
ncbi:FapA family protein [Alkalicoccobacillus murimartini]|nr:FapA family protein [Alkalicoccobacillus murimartini]